MSASEGFSRQLAAAHFRSDAQGRMLIGGVPVDTLAAQFGTPLYAYDAAVIRRRYRTLREAVGGFADIHYSIKANPAREVIALLLGEGAGVEIASIGEYRRAREAGAAPSQIIFAGPGKRRNELEEAVGAGIHEIHVETREELMRLDAIGQVRGAPVAIGLRINPGPAAQGGAMRMGGKPTAFGFDEEEMAVVVGLVGTLPRVRLTGIHVFAGTQILSAETLVGQWAYGLDLAARVATLAGHALETIDLGGGLGIPYHAGDAELDLAALKQRIPALAAQQAAHQGIAGARVVIEPGRFLVGPAGVYLSAVNAVKASRGKTFVVIDGGMHHHLAASGNLGQVIKRDYPVLAVARLAEAGATPVSVVGPLCTPLDTLAREAVLPPLAEGDLVGVLQSGAYGLTASPVGFLSHPLPAEVLVEDGKAIEIGR